MSSDWLRHSLKNMYGDAFDALDVVLRDCPDDTWTTSVWRVRRNDRHVLPITAGMGANLPEEERLQLHSAFCNVVLHVLFFADHYLSGGLGEPQPPPPFEAERQKAHTLPLRVYTREELRGYLEYCQRKAASVLDSFDDETVEQPARIGRPFGDLLIGNLLQMNEHISQLALVLNREAGWTDPRSTPEDRWFRKCPDCP